MDGSRDGTLTCRTTSGRSSGGASQSLLQHLGPSWHCHGWWVVAYQTANHSFVRSKMMHAWRYMHASHGSGWMDVHVEHVVDDGVPT